MRKRIVSILLIVMLFNLVIMPINTVYSEQSDIIWLEEDYDWVNAFSEGLSIIRLDGKYGFIDKMGIEVVSPKYHYLSFFSEGLAIAELNGKWGVINKIEKEVIPFKYDYIDFGYMKNPFGEGLIAVQLDGRWGYLDNTNTE
ncbi:MAG: WG repeat-containing protein, partial [Clostridiales bacterium]|nr:WG repeat-containing protein [Clostridiales bacterium]